MSAPQNPYSDRPPRSFWRHGVAQNSPLEVPDIFTPKWPLDPGWTIATAGSCFAQHIARHLRQSGARVIDVEPPPNGLVDPAMRARFGYGLYSARYGNIYTARQLRQLIEEAQSGTASAEHIWERDGRYFDALRPNVEPDGLASAEDVRAHRQWHIERVRAMIEATDLFIFTLGLTEAWEHIPTGRVYPTAPGVIAGDCDPGQYRFVNFTFPEVHADLTQAIAMLRDMRGAPMRVLLTVSPVPLTATAEDHHVLLSSTYSKSVLRAVAGHVAAQDAQIDYFPSFEIVTNPAARGVFFAPNLRSVTPEGVDVVMRHFKNAHQLAEAPALPAEDSDDDVVCEEAMLEAFAK
ncbi:MAG: GSCFA domain-containing protein [Pseudomonadota bacterium]